MDVIAAVDIGTAGAKATLIGRDGSIVAGAYFGYPTHGAGSRVEQAPADWWTATAAGLREAALRAPAARPVAVALSGQMQDLILVSERASLGPAILYSDTRAQAEAAAVTQILGDERLCAVTGNLQDASGLLAKLLWLKRHEPERYRGAKTLFLGAHDYVAWRLCGARVTDYTTASTTGLLDLARQAWALDLIAALDLRSDWLPELVAADARIGGLDDGIARDLGLPAGIPVIHGAGDAGTTTLGAGAGEPGIAYCYLGTSGWLAASSAGAPVDPHTGIFNLRHPHPERLILIGPMLTAAGNFAWLAEQFGALESRAAGKDRALPAGEPGADPPAEPAAYELLTALAARSQPGSGGLLYLPYLAGERAPFRDALARGVFFGLSRHSTRQDVYRALLEGVAFAMRSIYEAMPAPAHAGAARELRLLGGGARSPLWPQMFADVLRCPVSVLAAPGEVAARGAALIAGNALGWYVGYRAGPNLCPVAATYSPDLHTAQVYERLYPVFRALYPALKTTFALLADNYPATKGNDET